MIAQIKNIDAVDVSATNISCDTLSIAGEPVSTVLQNIGESSVGLTEFNGTVEADSLVATNTTTTNLTSQITNAGALTASSISTTGSISAVSAAVTGALTVDGNVLVVDPVNNRVGVNQSTPTQALDVNGNVKANQGQFTSATITNDLVVDTSTLVVNPFSNRVGIGTASPAQTLDVQGTALFSNTASAGALTGLQIFAPNLSTNSHSNKLQIGKNSAALGSAQMTYTTNGNVDSTLCTLNIAGELPSIVYRSGKVAMGALSQSVPQWPASSSVYIQGKTFIDGDLTVAEDGEITAQSAVFTSKSTIGPTTDIADTEVLRLKIGGGTRDWIFEQTSTGATAGLRLRSVAGDKTFTVSGNFVCTKAGAGTDAISIGNGAGVTSQNQFAVAIGSNAGNSGQGSYSIAVGFGAGASNQLASSVAIGSNAAGENQSEVAVAIGPSAGRFTQATGSVAIGSSAGRTSQFDQAVAIGSNAGYLNQKTGAVGIGRSAAYEEQGAGAVAVGDQSGRLNQGQTCVAIGYRAGETSQSTQFGNGIAIGNFAANSNQGNSAVAVGNGAGQVNQSSTSVAIGYQAGSNGQNSNAVAIGREAGKISMGSNSIMIGALAGRTLSHSGCIMLNATGVERNTTGGNSCFIDPIRQTTYATGGTPLYYNTTTKEVTYTTTPVGTTIMAQLDTQIVVLGPGGQLKRLLPDTVLSAGVWLCEGYVNIGAGTSGTATITSITLAFNNTVSDALPGALGTFAPGNWETTNLVGTMAMAVGQGDTWPTLKVSQVITLSSTASNVSLFAEARRQSDAASLVYRTPTHARYTRLA